MAEECRIDVNILRIEFTPRHKQLGIYNMQSTLYSTSISPPGQLGRWNYILKMETQL